MPAIPADFFNIAHLTPDQRWAIQDFLLRQIGKPYDYAGILGFMLRAKS